jgi:Icc-related predicted phosphoesterase
MSFISKFTFYISRSTDTMQLAILSDMHGSLDFLEAVSAELTRADVVVIAGDITTFGNAATAEQMIVPIRLLNPNVVAVPGNCDTREVEEYLTQQGINIHGRSLGMNNTIFMGLGGSLPCPGRTPNEMPESALGSYLDTLTPSLADRTKPVILVSHQPPYGTKLDQTQGGHHTGSHILRAFIEEHQPLLAVSGHIHEAVGTDRIGQTLCVNPGPFKNGYYAMAEIWAGQATVELKRT